MHKQNANLTKASSTKYEILELSTIHIYMYSLNRPFANEEYTRLSQAGNNTSAGNTMCLTQFRLVQARSEMGS